ncbi:MAG: peptidylprolyl isomerase [Pseudomonadota bacterium]
MKHHLITALLLSLALGSAGLHAADSTEPTPGAGESLLNRIVAVVNDGIIVSSELDQAMANVSAQLQGKGTPLPPRDVLEKQVLERLVVEKLQLQLAETNGMTIDDSALNNEVQDLARRNGISVAEFRAVLERDGFSYAAFREDLRRQLLIQELRRQMVGNRIRVTDQEIDNLLAALKASGTGDVEYHLAHILVAIPEAASPEQVQAAERKATDILGRLRAGADFTQTAIAESDAQTALEGGDIGWRSLGQMPELFIEPLKDMHTGDISTLIRSPGGFHIIKLLEKRGDERHIMRQTHVRQILLKEDDLHSDTDNADRIRQLELRLRGGEDFATLARSHSQDTLTAAKGGDLGWLGPGDTIPEFESVMNGLAPGEISAPLHTRYGWHLIQVLEYRDRDDTVEFERNRAKNLIRSRKYDEELVLWLRRLRDEAYVEFRLTES